MTAIALPVQLLAPHPGRRARPGPVRQAVTVTRVTTAVTAVAMLTGGWLAAGHPKPQHPAPRCVPWHTCACRYPGTGQWPGNNRLCLLNWGTQPQAGARP